MSDVKNAEYWEQILENEGLGVIKVDEPYKGVDIKHIKGKWARLDAEINGIKPGSAGVMTNSPVTARGTDSRETNRKHGEPYYTDDGYLGDNVWDNLILAHTGTAKEAEIADRARGAVCGLDAKNRVRSLKIPRKHREPGKEWRKRIHRHILGEVAMGPGPAYSKYQPTPPPYAHSDAGNGPLSIVDIEEPAYKWVPSCEANWALEPDDSAEAAAKPDQVRMAPIVDTMYYPSGRGPYQMSRIMQSNSDITG